jgi:hypothetical protein
MFLIIDSSCPGDDTFTTKLFQNKSVLSREGKAPRIGIVAKTFLPIVIPVCIQRTTLSFSKRVKNAVASQDRIRLPRDARLFRRMHMFLRGVVLVAVVAVPALAAEEEKPLAPVEARKQVGKEITVEMEVKAAKNALEKRGEIYLDSEENFRDEKNFAVVITKKGAESLNAAGIDNPADHYRGKTIRAKGKVTEVDGIPRIEIDDAKQISIPEKK